MSETRAVALTTALAVEAVAWGRAPKCRYEDGRESWVNQPIVCADGFDVSVQASGRHYANDITGGAPYWNRDESEIAYPFTTFEVGYPSEDPPADVWDEFEGGGIWAWVPRQIVADLLDAHGGAVGWKAPR